MRAFKGSLSERNSQVWESVLSSKTITTRVFLSQEEDLFIKAVVVSLNASLSLDQIYQTVRVPYAGNGPVFPPVLERLSVCRGRWPNRSVLRLGSPPDVWIPVFPAPHQAPLPDPAGGEMDCVRISLSWEEKKKKASIIWQLNRKSPKCWFLFSPCWSGRRRWNLRMTDVRMDGFTHRTLCSECEGTHGCFVGMSAGFPLAVNSDAHVGGLSGCAPHHTQRSFKIFAYVRWHTRKQGASAVVSVQCLLR